MTENASTLSDSTRKLNRKQPPCITKIKKWNSLYILTTIGW
jgi:hypothetical protein